jgi:hypothetical protein
MLLRGNAPKKIGAVQRVSKLRSRFGQAVELGLSDLPKGHNRGRRNDQSNDRRGTVFVHGRFSYRHCDGCSDVHQLGHCLG